MASGKDKSAGPTGSGKSVTAKEEAAKSRAHRAQGRDIAKNHIVNSGPIS